MPLDFLNACFFLIYKAKHKHTMISSSLIEAQMKTYYIGALYKFFPKYFSLFLLYATPDLTSFSRAALYKARNCEFSKEVEVKKSKKKRKKRNGFMKAWVESSPPQQRRGEFWIDESLRVQGSRVMGWRPCCQEAGSFNASWVLILSRSKCRGHAFLLK